MTAIAGPAAANAALTTLLAQIEAALTAAGPSGTPGYSAALSKAKENLRAFIKSTTADFANPAEIAAVTAVDDLAFDTLEKLSLTAMQVNIQILQAGAEKLRMLAGQLDAQTKTNVASAASIGLKGVKDAVDQMTTIVNSVKKLRSDLKTDKPDEKAIADDIGKLVDQFEVLKGKVDKIA
jgi:hypothetical protein